MSLFTRGRRTTQKHLRHREDAELNLIPLIDILSVMVAFLLVYGELVTSIAEIEASSTPLIEPLRAVLQRPLLAGEAAGADPTLAAREITVMGDKSLPYDVVRRVMATCTAAAYGKISLAVLQREKPVAPRSAKAA
jgi:biopolymer transport protein ExbD